MKKLLLPILGLFALPCLPLAAINIPATSQETITNVLEAIATPETTATFDIVSPGINTTTNGGPAIFSTLPTGQWTINNPSFPIIAAPGNSAIQFAPIVETFTLINADQIQGQNEGISSSTSSDSTIINTGSTATISGTNAIQFPSVGGNSSISNIQGTITGTGDNAIFLQSITANNTITNTQGTITGINQGISINKSGTSNNHTSTINNTNGSIIGTNGNGILLNNTITGNNVINNTATDSLTASISGSSNAILSSVITGNNTISNTADSSSSATISGVSGINLTSILGNNNITNSGPASITGATASGININSVTGDNSLTNSNGASISSTTANAVFANTIFGNNTISNTSGSTISGASALSFGAITGNNSITNSGPSSSLMGGFSVAILATSITGNNTISNTDGATISGSAGINIPSIGGNNSITNSGSSSSIIGTADGGIFVGSVTGNSTVTNSGGASISGLKGINIQNVGGNNTITNSGSSSSIVGEPTFGIGVESNIVAGNSTVTNTGTISGSIGVRSVNIIGNSTVTNSGTSSSITGTTDVGVVSIADGNSMVSNTNGASIIGNTLDAISSAAKGTNTIINSGGSTIQGNTAAIFSDHISPNTLISISNTDSLIKAGIGANVIAVSTDPGAINSVSIINNSGSAARIQADPAGLDAIQFSSSEAGFIGTVNNTNGAQIEGQDEGIQLRAFPSIVGQTLFTINNTSGSSIKSLGGIVNQSLAGIGNILQATNSHATINNSSNAIIEGSTSAIELLGTASTAPCVPGTSVTVNNSATIKGTGSPGHAIYAQPGARGALTVNLDTGSKLIPSNTTAILGTDDPDDDAIDPKPNTINLAGTATQNGDFRNINTLNKNGTGTWTLTPTVQHEIDAINVNQGTLTLTGTVLPNASTPLIPHLTIVNSGACLKGTNIFGTAGNGALDILPGATHKPGNSIGTTIVNGSYNLQGTLEVEYDADTFTSLPLVLSDGVGANQANVSGATIDAKKIAGTLQTGKIIPFLQTPLLSVDSTPKTFIGGPESCDPFTAGNCFGVTKILNRIVDGQKLIVLGFNNSISDFLSLLAQKASFSEILSTLGNPSPNSLTLAQFFDSLTPPPGSPLEDLKNALLPFDAAELAEALNNISSSPLADTSFLTQEMSQDILYLIRSHASNLRDHNPPARKESLWFQPFMDFQDRDNATQFAGLDARTFGFAAGYDKFFCNPHFNLGGTLAYTHTNFDWKRNLGNSKINSIFWGPYASWKCLDDTHEGYYLDAAFLIGFHLYDNKRSVPLTNLVAKSDPNGWSLDTRLGAGYNFLLSNIYLSPFAYIDHLWTRQKAFNETGAGNAGFALGHQSHNMMRYELGTSLSQNFDLGCGWVLAPKLSLSWVLKDPIGKQNLSTSFIGQNGFTIQSYDKTRNQFALGTELTTIIDEHLFVSVFYNAEIGDNQHSHTTGLRGSFRF